MRPESAKLATTPIWQEALPPSELTPRDAIPDRVDVAVIGAGLTGLSAAYHVLAAHPGSRVVVLEAGHVGQGASSRNTGMLTPGVGQDLAALIRRWGVHAARDMYIHSLDAVRYVASLTASEGIDAGLHLNGLLVVARGPGGRVRLEKQAAALESLALPCERLDREGLDRHIRLEGGTSSDETRGPAALRLPVAGTLNPARLLAGLANAVRRRGGLVAEGAKVTALSRRAPVLVSLDQGQSLRATHVVVATGGYTRPLDVHRGRLIPLHLRVLLTEPLSPAQLVALHWPGREGVIDSRRLFNYFRLTDDDRILFGGGRPCYRSGRDPAEMPCQESTRTKLERELHSLFPALGELSMARTWSGVIDYSLDALPIIGNVPGHENVLFAGGWCGHGIALGTSSGRWVCELIDSGGPSHRLPWFRPRPPLAPPDPFRSLAVRGAGWAMEKLDQFRL